LASSLASDFRADRAVGRWPISRFLYRIQTTKPAVSITDLSVPDDKEGSEIWHLDSASRDLSRTRHGTEQGTANRVGREWRCGRLKREDSYLSAPLLWLPVSLRPRLRVPQLQRKNKGRAFGAEHLRGPLAPPAGLSVSQRTRANDPSIRSRDRLALRRQRVTA